MTSLHYMQFDSTYRNRFANPDPFCFEIDMESCVPTSVFNAKDPVVSGLPFNPFGFDLTDHTFNNLFDAISAVLITTTIDTVISSTKFRINTAGTFQTIQNWYKNAPITYAGSTRRITSFTPLSASLAEVCIESAFSTPLIAGGAATIDNASASVIPGPVTQLFIPGGSDIDNFYTGLVIENCGVPLPFEYATIQSYDPTTGLAVLDNPITDDANSVFKLRASIPDATHVGPTVLGAPPTSVVTLDLVSQNTEGAYVGKYILIENELRIITAYNSTTNEVTLQHPLNIAAGPYTYEIFCFDKDNCNGFFYSGSVVSQQQSVCYEVSLVRLKVPSKILFGSQGGSLLCQPYLYVQLESMATGRGDKLIYSNNPNSRKSIFIAYLDNCSHTKPSCPYISLDSKGMVQTVKFKPNDVFKLTVLLHNGKTPVFESTDAMSPYPPDPHHQISALFSIKRL